jgi:Fur family transcriptional regulator, ferric uptake regulator
VRYKIGSMKSPSVEALRADLRRAGLRATRPRLAVLAQLARARAPLTHGEVAEQLAEAGWDRATVYRNLMDLTETGLARRSDIGDHVWRFELVSEDPAHSDGEHPHFICGECGAVACLPEEVVSLKPGRGAPRALRRKGLAVQLRGVCDECL